MHTNIESMAIGTSVHGGGRQRRTAVRMLALDSVAHGMGIILEQEKPTPWQHILAAYRRTSWLKVGGVSW